MNASDRTDRAGSLRLANRAQPSRVHRRWCFVSSLRRSTVAPPTTRIDKPDVSLHSFSSSAKSRTFGFITPRISRSSSSWQAFLKVSPPFSFLSRSFFFCLFRLPFVLLLRLGPLCVSQFVWIPLCSSHTKTKTNKWKKNGKINPPSVVFHSLVMMRSFGPVRFNRLSR